MRVGIRTKLVVLLTTVALLPLLAALATMIVGGRRLRRESFGQTSLAMTSANAMSLEAGLEKDIEKLHAVFEQNSTVVRGLAAVTEPLPEAKRRELDRIWPTASQTEGPLARVLRHPISRALRRIQKEDPRVAEILVTDRFGQLVAASGRSTDYYQADEEWWQQVRPTEKDSRIHIPPVSLDISADVWSINLCMPIEDGERFLGVAKVVVDIWPWLKAVDREVDGVAASVALVRSDGRMLFRDDPERGGVKPLEETVSGWSETGRPVGSTWQVTGDKVIRAFAPIRLPSRVAGHRLTGQTWMLMLYMPESKALGAVYDLSLIMVGIGLAVVLGIFGFGLYLAERSIVRRIHRLKQATRDVAAGNLSHRVLVRPGTVRLMGTDEIDELFEDFNRMIRRVGDSHEALRNANELKTSFIQVAGHELRTPVSYLLAMAKLLEGSGDPDRLLRALRSMGDKAERLDEIIQAIFKLMPEQHPGQMLQYGDVDVGELVGEVQVDCAPFAEKRRQKLVVDSGQQVPRIRADRQKLRDAIENLVMNAIKFTPDGGRVRVTAAKQLGGSIAVAVADEGPGIAAEDLPDIFEPFFSSRDVMTHSSGGTGFRKRGIGLGLAIVKRFAEMHGGTVHVSTGQSGSTFTLTVPIEPPPGKPPVQPAGPTGG